MRGPRRVVREGFDVWQGLANLQRVTAPGSATSLNGPLGPHRRWAWARSRLSDVKRIREAHGGTVNDVVLAAITGGFRDLLLARGEDVQGRVVRTTVPVSVRAEHERGAYNNKVSAMFADLPVEIEDPVARLESIRAQMQKLKRSGQAVAAERLTALSGFAPAELLALAGRVASRVPQRTVNTVTTNVPGPQHPLFLCGRRMLEAFPWCPLVGHLRIGVAIFSYDGNLTFGVTGDRDTTPDITVLCAGIERRHRAAAPRLAAQWSGATAPPERRQDSLRGGAAVSSGERHARVGELELCYETFGADTTAPLLLVMGLGSQMVLWDDEFCQALADRGFWVIRFDNRDIGRSTILRDRPVPTPGQLLARDPRAASYCAG